MSSSVTDVVRAEIHGKALVLTLDRPQAGNSLSLSVIEALASAIAAHRDNADLVGVVITGAGSKFFCTGGDVKAYRAITQPAELDRVFGAARRLLHAIEDFPLPVLAAINGYAVGGGVELALSCDLRFADSTAQLSLPQVKLGIITGWNGTERLVRVVGRSRAIRMLLTGRRMSAAEAMGEGLIDAVASDALAAALEFLNGLDGAPLAIRGAKQAVRATDAGLQAAEKATRAILERLWFTADHREAEAAFVEKRPPDFRGS